MPLKPKTRENRGGGIQTQYEMEDNLFISNLKTKEFLSSAKTKEELTIYLSEKLIREVVVYDNKCETNMINFDNNLRVHCHEEADTLIVLHGIDVAKRDPLQELYIDRCDEDVFLLFLYYFEKLCTRIVFNDKNDCVDIGMLYEVLHKEKVKALPRFHAFTGCDQTGKFRGFSKETCWKTFIDSPEVVKSFQELGSSNEHPSKEVIHGLVLLVLDLCCNTRPNNVDTLGSLRWYMFSKYRHEGDKLPPTKQALSHMMCRSHYMARVWRSPYISKPILPDPCKFGCKLSADIENCYEPKMTDQKPTPVSVVELSLVKIDLKNFSKT